MRMALLAWTDGEVVEVVENPGEPCRLARGECRSAECRLARGECRSAECHLARGECRSAECRLHARGDGWPAECRLRVRMRGGTPLALVFEHRGLVVQDRFGDRDGPLSDLAHYQFVRAEAVTVCGTLDKVRPG